nr:MFS transporter [Cellulomonas hominis]
MLIILDGTIVNIALPSAQTELGLSDGSRQWVVTAYALTFGAFLLLGGRVADYWGRKRAYLLGLALFGAGSAWGGLTHSGGELLVARGVQGVAAALMAPAALAFVTLSFPDGAERNRAFAIFGSLGGAGSAIGMLLGGVLTEFLSWRWCLLINVPLVVVGVVAGAVLLQENRAAGDRRYDVAGAVTATLGFGLLVYGLTLAEHSWTSAATLGTVTSGLLLVGLFVLVEHRSSRPLLPLRVLADRTRAAAFAIQGLIGMVGVGAMVYLALHLQLVLHLPPLQAGLGTLPFTAALMGAVPAAIRMIDRVGPRRQMIVGPLISALGLVLLTQVSDGGSYWTEVLPGVVLMGLGMGFTVVPLNNLALHRVAPHDAGVASATITATNQLGGSIGLAVLTAVYTAVVGTGSMVTGNATVFAVGAGIYLTAAAVAWWLVRPERGAGPTGDDRVPEPAAAVGS